MVFIARFPLAISKVWALLREAAVQAGGVCELVLNVIHSRCELSCSYLERKAGDDVRVADEVVKIKGALCCLLCVW